MLFDTCKAILKSKSRVHCRSEVRKCCDFVLTQSQRNFAVSQCMKFIVNSYMLCEPAYVSSEQAVLYTLFRPPLQLMFVGDALVIGLAFTEQAGGTKCRCTGH